MMMHTFIKFGFTLNWILLRVDLTILDKREQSRLGSVLFLRKPPPLIQDVIGPKSWVS
jgi:hypothetical protein